MPASVVRCRYVRDKLTITQTMAFSAYEHHIHTESKHDLRGVPMHLLGDALRAVGMLREATERREAPDA